MHECTESVITFLNIAYAFTARACGLSWDSKELEEDLTTLPRFIAFSLDSFHLASGSLGTFAGCSLCLARPGKSKWKGGMETPARVPLEPGSMEVTHTGALLSAGFFDY